jgi:hypothetical protein
VASRRSKKTRFDGITRKKKTWRSFTELFLLIFFSSFEHLTKN